jgi:hypothetical protein
VKGRKFRSGIGNEPPHFAPEDGFVFRNPYRTLTAVLSSTSLDEFPAITRTASASTRNPGSSWSRQASGLGRDPRWGQSEPVSRQSRIAICSFFMG